jgi:glycine betaine catabolism B
MRFATQIIKISKETHDVTTFRLMRPPGFTFVAGQYCQVSFTDRFPGEDRPFTFSSSPEAPFLELTIKQMGHFTTALFALKVGQTLTIDGPNGEMLQFDESVRDDVVFVAGGSGITPFMSAIRFAQGKHLKNRLILLYSNKTAGDIVFRKELDAIKEVKIVHTLTTKAPPGWKGERGYISKGLISKHVPIPSAWLWYLCGPPPMIAAVRILLAELGVREDRIREEPWQIPGSSG